MAEIGAGIDMLGPRGLGEPGQRERATHVLLCWTMIAEEQGRGLARRSYPTRHHGDGRCDGELAVRLGRYREDEGEFAENPLHFLLFCFFYFLSKTSSILGILLRH